MSGLDGPRTAASQRPPTLGRPPACQGPTGLPLADVPLVKGLPGVVVFLWCALAAPTAGLAQDKDKPSQEKEKAVDLQVWAIRATKSNANIDPELKSIAEELKKQFKFTGFKLEKRCSGSAAVSKEFRCDLIGKYKAVVTPMKRDGKRIQLKIQITETKGEKEEPRLNTTVTIDGGTFQCVGGPSLEGGDTLIVAVSGR